MNLQIQCPACDRRFHVHEDLTGKTVECGACDQRFKVTPETVIESRDKFYPGEHHDVLLDRLGKKPPRTGQTVNFAKAEYTPSPETDAVLPATAGQKIAVTTGIAFILLYTLLFLVGSTGSVFDNVQMQQRLLLGGFVSLISSCLIIFGAKGWRKRSFVFSLFLSACLIGLILILPVHEIPSTATRGDAEDPEEQPQGTESAEEELSNEESEVKKRVDFAPMQREIDRKTEDGIDGHLLVTGIFIEGIEEIELIAVQQFLQRKLALPKDEAPTAYQRNGGKDRFIVFSGIPQRFETFVTHCEGLGKVRTHPSLRVIEIDLNDNLFEDPSPELHKKLTDPTDSAFFLTNLEQLDHVDLERVKKAVDRLGNIPEGVEIRKIPRMNEEFVRILREETDGVLLGNTGQALRVWAKGDQEVVSTVSRIVLSWNKSGRTIPKSLVEFLVENQSPEVALVVDGLWARNPEKWSEQYISLGSSMEDRLLFHLQGSPAELKKGALGILRKVGTNKSLPELEKLKTSEDDEIQILAVRAISAIDSRK